MNFFVHTSFESYLFLEGPGVFFNYCNHFSAYLSSCRLVLFALFTCCLSSLFCCSNTHHYQKHHGERKGLFDLQFIMHHQGTGARHRNVEAETKADFIEDHCLLTWSWAHIQPPILQGPSRPISLEMAPPAVSWALLHQLAIQKIMPPKTWPQAYLMETIPQLRLSSPRYAEVTTKLNYDTCSPQPLGCSLL